MQSPSEAPIKAKSTSKLEKINNSISEALSQYNGTIRILGDIPTERLDPENYLSSTQSLIKELTTYWETKATLRLLAIEIYPIHSYFALDFNNEKYDYQTADKDVIIIPICLLRISRKSGRWKIFRHVPSDRGVAIRIADLHEGGGWTSPTPFVEDHIKGVTHYTPRRILPPLTGEEAQSYLPPPIPKRERYERRYHE